MEEESIKPVGVEGSALASSPQEKRGQVQARMGENMVRNIVRAELVWVKVELEKELMFKDALVSS